MLIRCFKRGLTVSHISCLRSTGSKSSLPNLHYRSLSLLPALMLEHDKKILWSTIQLICAEVTQLQKLMVSNER